MPDLLKITGLKIAAQIGVHAWEKQIKQTLLVDLSVPCDYQQIEDDLNQVLDYATLCQSLTKYIETSSCELIEALANQVALHLKAEFNLKQFSLTISKPKAIPTASNVSITVTR